jgi:hypothetical protein
VASDVIGETNYDRWSVFGLKPAGNAVDYIRYMSRKRDLAGIKGHGYSFAGIDRMTGHYRILRRRSIRTDVEVLLLLL